MEKASVRISDIVDEMESLGDGRESYLNRVTGELFMITDEEWRAAEDGESPGRVPGGTREAIEAAADVLENPESYVSLPTRFDINEYMIMEDFAHSREDRKVSGELLEAINGRGAFRMFKLSIRRLEIEEPWFVFRRQAFEETARRWCRENGIDYTE
ncbi:MAG: hypothetical protein GXP52_08425 [Deltaproteobacteria bacterium]|nr:hypothetical protein [Deltaproteobacteria bacterium]